MSPAFNLPMAHIYLFHGDDSYSALHTAKHWQCEFEKKYGEGSAELLAGNEATAQKISEAISTLPFFSEKKLIIVKDFFREANTDELKKTADLLEKSIQLDTNKKDEEAPAPPHFVLVFVEHKSADKRTTLYKKLKKIGEVRDYSLKTPLELRTWIQQEFQKRNSSIASREAIMLADQVGPNLWQMGQEIEKLLLYSGTSPITNEAIEALVSPNIYASVFQLTDALGTKNQKLALKTLEKVVESGESIIKILQMLGWQVRVLMLIKEGQKRRLSPQEIAKQTGEKPFTINKTLQQCRNFEHSQLVHLHRAILDIDIKMKTGLIKLTTEDISELRLLVEKLLVEACR